VKRRLIGFLPDERARTGVTDLADCHFIEAALARVETLDQAAALGKAWQEAHRRDRDASMAGGSGTRLRKVTSGRVRDLAARLRGLDARVKLWEVAAEAVTRLLDELGAP
jgi:hypothetical protein